MSARNYNVRRTLLRMRRLMGGWSATLNLGITQVCPSLTKWAVLNNIVRSQFHDTVT